MVPCDVFIAVSSSAQILPKITSQRERRKHGESRLVVITDKGGLVLLGYRRPRSIQQKYGCLKKERNRRKRACFYEMMLTKAGRKWVVLSALLVFVSTSVSAKASTIAADNLTPTYGFSSFEAGIGFAGLNGLFSNETPAQEFAAVASGTVTTLTASIQQVQPQGVPLNVSIFTVANGLPGRQVGTISIAQAQVSSNVFSQLSVFNLSAAHVSLTADQSYFALFSVATPSNGSDRYEAVLLNPNAHSFGFPAIVSPDGGITWLTSAISNEIGVTVIVNTPEPSSVELVAMSIGTLFFFRRRKKT